ncbi:hypothetical protein ANCCEY_05217 [Ancylostoma ceylanicum]|uniref:Uncharacterized protein n=1 Tax=Ancylostoma ceylanicum TaxID=53326 RepID=A0A0D6M702_9BILA|nr:hypothetical protein ANCCEY_05217 [Ancylostoma ceylanicum]
MENDLKEELGRRRRAAWAAFGPLREATDQLTDHELRAYLFDSTPVPRVYTWLDELAAEDGLHQSFIVRTSGQDDADTFDRQQPEDNTRSCG